MRGRENSGGGGFSKRSPSPGPLPKRWEEENAGGEAASLREAPLPQTPSPEERMAFELGASADLVPPESWGCVSCGLVMVTAADRAAVTTAQPIGDARTLHGCASPQERTSLFPDALRERGRGEGRNPGEAASLKEASATSIGAASGRLFRLRKTAIAATGGYGCLSLPRAHLPKSRWRLV